jgi:hypothetical protein
VELRESKQRLEKRLNDLQNSSRIRGEVAAVLETFDHDLGLVLTDLTQNRLRFNSFVRIFFSALVVEVDRPGMGWRRGKKKGELPICNARIQKFALEPRFGAFVAQTGMDLPEALKKAERYSWNLWDNHGSPCMW